MPQQLVLALAGLLLAVLILRARDEGFELPELTFPFEIPPLFPEPVEELPELSPAFPVDPSTAAPIFDLPTESQSWPSVWNAPEVGSYPGSHNEYDNQILYACNIHEMHDALAPLIVKAIITHESGWNASACGDRVAGTPVYRGGFAGCCSIGLMQVNRCAHPGLAARLNLGNPNENILAGCELLAIEYRKYWPNLERVMVGYNGPALAARGISSNAYSRAVASHFRRLAAQLGVSV